MKLSKKMMALGTVAVVSLGVLGANVAPVIAGNGGGQNVEKFHAAQTSLQDAIQIAETESGSKAVGASFRPQVGSNGAFVIGLVDDNGNVTVRAVDATDGTVQQIASAGDDDGPEGRR